MITNRTMPLSANKRFNFLFIPFTVDEKSLEIFSTTVFMGCSIN